MSGGRTRFKKSRTFALICRKMNARQIKKIKRQIGKKYRWYSVSRRCETKKQMILAENEVKAVEKFINRFLHKYKTYPADYSPGRPIRMIRQFISDYEVITPDGFTFYFGQ